MRLLVVLVLLVLGACGKHLYNRDDLQVELSKHHIDLRWGRLENAARPLQPELRGPFLTSWAQQIGQIELQDIELTGMALSEDGDTADVVVAVTWIERSTMAVKVTNLPERWVRTDEGWRCSHPAEMPAAALSH